MEMILRYNKIHGIGIDGKKKDQLVIGPGNESMNDTLPCEEDGASDDRGSEVSERSMDENDIVNIVGSGVDIVGSGANVSQIVEDECVTVELIIEDEYCEDEAVPHLPPVDTKLAKVLTEWLRVAPPRDKVKEYFKRCMIPENVDGLLPVRINQLLYEKLNFNGKLNDQKLQGINTYLARGLGPLVAIWDQILKWEAMLLSGDKNKQFKLSAATLSHNECKLDFTGIRKNLDTGIRLLCVAHSTILARRRFQLQSFFDPCYHYLLKPSNPITTELLGDNVDAKIAESNKLFEAAQKLQLKQRPIYSGRTYGHGNNYYPYSRGFCNSHGRRPYYDHNRRVQNSYRQDMTNQIRGNHNKCAHFSSRGHSFNMRPGNRFLRRR